MVVFTILFQLELLATFSPNANLLSHTSILLLLFIYLKNNKCLATPCSTSVEDRDVRLLSFFCRKFNFQQLLCEASEIGDVDSLHCFLWHYLCAAELTEEQGYL